MNDTDTIRLGAIEIRFLHDTADTQGRLSAFEFIVPPGAKVPAPHFHEHVDEMIYGLEGELTFSVAGEAKSIGPGQSCFVPRGVVHHFVNNGSVATRTLAVLTPGSIGSAYFRELADLLAAGGPPDPVKVTAIMKRHGLVVVPPK